MTDSTYTHITLVADRSGSMSSIQGDAEGAINAFIEEQKKVPGRCTFTLIQFDDVIETVFDNVDLQSVGKYELRPRNMTALADAWGRAINDTGDYLSSLPEAERPGNVILVVVTDGLENASREFSTAKVREMTEHQRNTYNWQVIFLAANQDAVAVGRQYGVAPQSAMSYDMSGRAVMDSYSSVSQAVTGVRTKGGSVAFTDEDRKKAKSTSQ